MKHCLRILLLVLASSLLPATAQVMTLSVPAEVVGDADNNQGAPWLADAETYLQLGFDSPDLPIGASIQSMTLRVQGASLAPSYLSEIQLYLILPSGDAFLYDFGEVLGYPDNTSPFDTTELPVQNVAGQVAEGRYLIAVGDDYNDEGADVQIDQVDLVVTYEVLTDSLVGTTPVGPYFNNVFPALDTDNGGASPPATLSGTGAFTDLATLAPAAGLIPYELNSPLFSDNAEKLRWVSIPTDGNRDSATEQIQFRPELPWTYPAGTVAVKHFELPTNANNPLQRRRLETRFLVATGNGDFYGLTYRWRLNGSDADLVSEAGASANYTVTEADGSSRVQRWDFPSRSDCRTCHNKGGGVFLGLTTWQLNRAINGAGTPRNQLDIWAVSELFNAPIGSPAYLPAAAPLDDTTAPLETRVRSYLASNCANCHNDRSEEDLNADFDLSFWNTLAETRMVNGVPLYDLGVNDARVVKPGSPDASVLLLRMEATDVHKMPPIGRNLVDDQAVALVRQWIEEVQDPGNDGVVTNIGPGGATTDITFTDASNRLADPTSASGVAMAVVDMNNDGRDDIVRLKNARDLNVDYQPDNATSVFSTLSLGRPSSEAQWGMAVGDIDNNGVPDIVTGGFYDGLHVQRANSIGSNYSTVTLNSPSIFLQGASFADMDNDGWLDLFPTHDEGLNPPFRNNGNGTFVHDPGLIDTTTTPASDNSGNYGLTWTDYDNDGDQDLYISKCRGGANSPLDPRRINQLFRRNADGSFTEVAAAAGLADGAQSWTADFADIDNDGDLDCFIGNHSGPSRLLENDGAGTFTEITAASGIAVDWRVIQAVFRDFNNDGWIDLLLAGEEQNLWLNQGNQTFTLAENPFAGAAMESCAVGDLNRDGFPDVYAGYARLYNSPQAARPDRMFLSVPNGNNFLSVSLRGTQSNRSASGARLELHGPWGVQLREVRTGEGYGVTHSLSQRFGMGTVAQAEKLVIRWPSGQVDTIEPVTANQFLELVEGSTSLATMKVLPVQIGNYYGISFLVPNSATRMPSGETTSGNDYEPCFSTDLETWTLNMQKLANPQNLPDLPSGSKYVTYCIPQDDLTRIFFRVNITQK